MKKKQSLVAFIDILGFQNHVNDYFSGKDPSKLQKLENALRDADKFAIQLSKQVLKQFKIKQSIKQFSDCVSISIPIDANDDDNFLNSFNAFINVVRLYQFILLDQEILVRGGISMGSHYENGKMIFSEGLIRSYKLESENAIYPRIVISKELIQALYEKLMIKKADDFEKIKDFYLNNIIQDWDDEIFVNPFGLVKEGKDLIENHREIFTDFFPKQYSEELFNNGSMEQLHLHHDWKYVNKVKSFALSYLKENESEKSSILLKYKWLADFCVWNNNELKSRIKFRRYFNQEVLIETLLNKKYQ